MFIAHYNNTGKPAEYCQGRNCTVMPYSWEKERIIYEIQWRRCPIVSLQLQCSSGGLDCRSVSSVFTRIIYTVLCTGGASSIFHSCTSYSYVISSIQCQGYFFTIFHSHSILHYSFRILAIKYSLANKLLVKYIFILG